MAIAGIAAPGAAPRDTSALPGVLAGAGLGGAVALGTAKAFSFPAPVALGAGALVGGPIAAISIMNNDGKPNAAWQSALTGAAPFAAVGGALGVAASWWGGPATAGPVASALSGAVMIGLVGAGLGLATHFATKPD